MKKLILIMAVALTAALSARAQYTELYYQRASHFATLPVDSTDIVMLGNSLTHGCEWNELLGLPNVKNRGINGDIVQGIRDRIEPIVSGRPAKIFLLTGVNDVSHHIGVDSLVTVYTELIDYIRQATPDTKLYVESMLPINNSFKRYKNLFDEEDTIPAVNERLAAIAEEKGFTWINLFPHFADEEGHLRSDLTNDGLHLLGPGYLIWRDIIMPYVLE